MKIKKIVLLLSLLIVLLPLFYGAYIYAINTGKVNGVYGNYFRGYQIYSEKDVNTVTYCQLVEESFYMQISVFFDRRRYSPLRKKDFTESNKNIYEKLKQSKIHIKSHDGDEIPIINFNGGTFISFVSEKKISPGLYTVYVTTPKIDTSDNYLLLISKLNEYLKVGNKVKMRSTPGCV